MAENENKKEIGTNTYFDQLKKKMLEDKDAKNPEEKSIFSKGQEIYKKITEEKELSKENKILELNESKILELNENKALELNKSKILELSESKNKENSPSKEKSSLDMLKDLKGKLDLKKEIDDLLTNQYPKIEDTITKIENNPTKGTLEAPTKKEFEVKSIDTPPSDEIKVSMDFEKVSTSEKDINQSKKIPGRIFFEERKENSKDLEWLKKEIIEEPAEKDFEEEIKQPNNEPKKEINKSKEINNQNKPKTEDPFKKADISFAQTSTNKEELDLSKYKTPVDDAFKLIEEQTRIDLGELSALLSMDYFKVEKIMKTFEDEDIVDIEYPTSLNKKPMIILKNPIKSKILEKPDGKVIDSYEIIVDKVPAKLSVILSVQENRPVYCIEIPTVGKYTKKFIDFIKGEIAENMPIELDEILDPKKAQKLKERFFEESRKHLETHFPTTNKETLDMLSGVIMHEMYGLGDIELLMGDDMLEEVGINSAKTPITVYHRIYGWLKTNMYPGNEEEIMNFSSQIGRKVGREITTLTPILDAHLLSGDRVNATLFPISSEGNTLTIRRFARKPWTLIDFIGKAHTMNSEMAALLWLAMQYEMNIIIAGGTASGKTSALNTMLSLVPSYHRIISIEDVREIILPKYLDWNWIPMVTRAANPEGLGEVTMLDCMVSSLRMRPDRIIVGEIRRKKEAEVLMEAIETGHSIYSTIHANSAYQVLRRLAEPPMSIPLMQIELVDLIVTQFRDRKTNKRRTFEIAEIEQTSTGKGLQVSTIYKWVPRTDSWEKLNKPNKILTMLNLHTGLTEDEINKELKEREMILDWMRNNNLSELDMIGYLVKMFYADPDRIKKLARENTSIDKIKTMMEEK